MQIIYIINLPWPYLASVKSAGELMILHHEDLHLLPQIHCLLVLNSNGHVK